MVYKYYWCQSTQQVLANVSGFVAVSSKNKKELIDCIFLLKISQSFPNGVDSSVFYKRDKSQTGKDGLGYTSLLSLLSAFQ